MMSFSTPFTNLAMLRCSLAGVNFPHDLLFVPWSALHYIYANFWEEQHKLTEVN